MAHNNYTMEDFFNNPPKEQEEIPNFFRVKTQEKKGFDSSPFVQKIKEANLQLEQSAIEHQKNILEKILAKFFPNIYKARKIKSALLKLDNLNKIVREMVEKNTDDEGQEKHYKILSNYINRANEIQSELKKEI